MKFLKLYFLLLFVFIWSTMNVFSQNIKFNHTYGHVPYNYGKRVLETGDRGFMILGNASAESGNTNILIIRTDSLGLIKYEKNIGDASLYWANDFIRTSDKGFLITGTTIQNTDNSYDVLLIKTDSNANVIWEKFYGGNNWDIGKAVVETPDNSYLIAGTTYSFGNGDENLYVIKTNFYGDTLWTKVFGGDSSDFAESIDVRYDGSYLVAGATKSFGKGDYDGYVLNLNANGDTIWTKTYGQSEEDIIYSIKCTPDSGFVFVGSTKSYNAVQHEIWLMKYDKNQNFVWMMPEFWNIGQGDDVAYSVTINDSAWYVISGYTTGAGNGAKEVMVLIMAENNDFKHSMTAGSIGNEIAYSSIQTKDKGYAVIGYSDEIGSCITNIYLLKIGNNCSASNTTEHILQVQEYNASERQQFFQMVPNISDGLFYLLLNNYVKSDDVTIDVFDITGRKIPIKLQVYDDAMMIDMGEAMPGMYLVAVAYKNSIKSFKVIKNN